VFLINSRAPFVTATRYLHTWHPLYRRYRANLPNSLDSIIPIRLGLFSQGHPSRFSVRLPEILATSLFIDPGPRPNLAAIPLFSPLLTVTVLQGPIRVRVIDTRPKPSPKRQLVAYRYRNRIQVAQDYEPVSLSLPTCYEGD
jgi:hypothetical protein